VPHRIIGGAGRQHNEQITASLSDDVRLLKRVYQCVENVAGTGSTCIVGLRDRCPLLANRPPTRGHVRNIQITAAFRELRPSARLMMQRAGTGDPTAARVMGVLQDASSRFSMKSTRVTDYHIQVLVRPWPEILL